MKTSVIEAHDMLSVLTVDEVEKRIGEVPVVASATVKPPGWVTPEGVKPYFRGHLIKLSYEFA